MKNGPPTCMLLSEVSCGSSQLSPGKTALLKRTTITLHQEQDQHYSNNTQYIFAIFQNVIRRSQAKALHTKHFLIGPQKESVKLVLHDD